jgi:hypothetical protein
LMSTMARDSGAGAYSKVVIFLSPG